MCYDCFEFVCIIQSNRKANIFKFKHNLRGHYEKNFIILMSNCCNY